MAIEKFESRAGDLRLFPFSLHQAYGSPTSTADQSMSFLAASSSFVNRVNRVSEGLGYIYIRIPRLRFGLGLLRF